MMQLILVFHVLVAVALIVLVLIQQGKGAEVGAAFGSGASQTLFGSQGSSSFLLKVTGILAALFFATSLTLGYLAAHQTKTDVLQNLNGAPAITAPAPAKPADAAATQTPVAPAVPAAGVPIPEGQGQKGKSN